MEELEIKLFYLFNKSFINPVLDSLLPILTLLGEYAFSWFFAIALLIFLRKEKKVAAVVLLAGLVSSGFLVFVLKTIFPREAPFVALHNVRHVIIEPDPSCSFPSGHATCPFLIAAVLSSYFGYAGILFFMAAIVAFARVYGGVHYVSDIVAGAIIGTATGYILAYAERKISPVLLRNEKFNNFVRASLGFFTRRTGSKARK